MGKNKGFNWKSRQVVETTIDNSRTKKIVVDIKGIRSDVYDDCNALVIPSEKRRTKKKKGIVEKKILSKKQKRVLQQIVDRKNKKQQRASLLESLSQVQASPELLKQLIPITKFQTYGLKHKYEQDLPCQKANSDTKTTTNIFKGYKKRQKLLDDDLLQQCANDPNIVGFEVSSDSSEDDEDNEEEINYAVSNEANNKGVDECVNEDTNEETIKNGVSNENQPLEGIEGNATGKKDDERNDNNTDKCIDGKAEDPGRNVVSEDGQLSNKNSNCCIIEETKDSAPKEMRKATVERKPAIFVPLSRLPGVNESRMKLPILAEEQGIMEAITENDVVVLAGETGSGKTTQLPQFLYEAGYARNGKVIGITEPRRVAAISMSKRVAYEMGLPYNEVSYLIRYEGNISDKTSVKFMTDGVLLKEIQSDFILSRYSVILLDEAHERSVYTDILLGLLSRIVPLRRKQGNPLKLVVMSATLRLEDFVENERLFRIRPPVITVESRQFPVTVHFNKHTRENYVREAYLKTCKIHTQLPDGGILIFVTGQQEVNTLVRKLRSTFPYKKNSNFETEQSKKGHESIEEEESEDESVYHRKKLRKEKKEEIPLPAIDLDEFPLVSTGGDDDSDLALDDDDDDDLECVVKDPLATRVPMWVLPLYSLLPGSAQAKVFEPPPVGTRLCVVATNVAETSLTIPSVCYVVDCGKEKRRRYDKVTGVSTFIVAWISKASANQRAGRAGRTGPGHCYRLYSSAIFNDELAEYSIPEMQQKPVDDLVLQMKSMGIHKVVNFPFPSPPGLLQLQAAERRLVLLGALKAPGNNTKEEGAARITPLGQSMAAFPVAPQFAKMLALSHQQGLLPYTICMVAALAVPEVLVDVAGNNTLVQARRAWAGTGNSLLLGDPVVLMRAVGAAEHAGSCGDLEEFCKKHALRYKAVVEVRKLRLQLTTEINSAVPDIDLVVDPKMSPPSDEQARLLRQLLLSGLGDQVAHSIDPDTFKDKEDRIKWKHAYRCAELEEPVRIHSTSVLKREHPKWVVFQEVFETSQSKLFMRGVTAIEPEWLPSLAPALCNLSEPFLEPPPHYDAVTDQIMCHVSGTYGRAAWSLPVVLIDFPSGLLRYKWFAVFFLNGSVCPKLGCYTSQLLSSPNSMTKSWARLQPRTEHLLKALIDYEVSSRKKLNEEWEKNKNYLLETYLEWLPRSSHNEVSLIWPPL